MPSIHSVSLKYTFNLRKQYLQAFIFSKHYNGNIEFLWILCSVFQRTLKMWELHSFSCILQQNNLQFYIRK